MMAAETYFKDPAKARDVFARHPDKRHALIAQFLFMGCLTGRRLQAAFGEELCDQIIWEETSPEVGGHSASRFQADIGHMAAAIKTHHPDIVIAFGQVASGAILPALSRLGQESRVCVYVITAPHPAARGNPLPALRRVAEELRERLNG